MTELDQLVETYLRGGSLSETVAGMARSDPDLAPIAQLLAAREAVRDSDPDEADDADPDLDELVRARRAVDADLRRERTQLVRRHIEELADEVQRLQASLESVAAALGACPACLGSDPDCPLCRGRGRPGSLPPDPEAFDRTVLPAVRAHAYARTRYEHPRPHASQEGTEHERLHR